MSWHRDVPDSPNKNLARTKRRKAHRQCRLGAIFSIHFSKVKTTQSVVKAPEETRFD